MPDPRGIRPEGCGSRMSALSGDPVDGGDRSVLGRYMRYRPGINEYWLVSMEMITAA